MTNNEKTNLLLGILVLLVVAIISVILFQEIKLN